MDSPKPRAPVSLDSPCSLQVLLHCRRALDQGMADAFGGLVDTLGNLRRPFAHGVGASGEGQEVTAAVNRRALVRVASIVVTPL